MRFFLTMSVQCLWAGKLSGAEEYIGGIKSYGLKNAPWTPFYSIQPCPLYLHHVCSKRTWRLETEREACWTEMAKRCDHLVWFGSSTKPSRVTVCSIQQFRCFGKNYSDPDLSTKPVTMVFEAEKTDNVLSGLRSCPWKKALASCVMWHVWTQSQMRIFT